METSEVLDTHEFGIPRQPQMNSKKLIEINTDIITL
jgi:hypothetical protein